MKVKKKTKEINEIYRNIKHEKAYQKQNKKQTTAKSQQQQLTNRIQLQTLTTATRKKLNLMN